MGTGLPTLVTPSPPNHAVTSSDEDDGSPNANTSSSPRAVKGLLPASEFGALISNDLTKVVLSGYLMKCGKQKSWRKRWFVLMGEKLLYLASHGMWSAGVWWVEAELDHMQDNTSVKFCLCRYWMPWSTACHPIGMAL